MDGIKGRPVFTNDQIDLANEQMQDTFTANPNLDPFHLIGGGRSSGRKPTHRSLIR